MASFEKIRSASEKHAASRDSILVQLLKLLFGLWDGYDTWDDADVVAGMAARSASLVAAATGRARLVNRSYVTTVLRELDALPKELPPLVNAYPRANTDASEVYARPVEQFIWRRRNGSTLEESKEAFQARLREIAETDIAAADRDEARLLYDYAPNVSGYRRVIHPELSKSGTCGLCIVASAQVYRNDDLMPLHGGSCNCDTMPITGSDDPGLRLNDDDLKSIYAAAGSTAAEDLQNTRIKITEHGELGPVLVKQGDHFKTAKEAGRPEYVKQTPAVIRAANERARDRVTADIASAQARYDAIDKTFTDSPADDERVALFRSIKYQREYLASLTRFLATLPA